MFRIQVSTIGRFVGLNLAGDPIPDLIRMLEEFFFYLDSFNIQNLIKKFKEKLTVFCYKTIDYGNSKEIRKSVFSIMLEILDAYDNIFKGDTDFLILMLNSIDFQSFVMHKGEALSNISEVVICGQRLENMYFTGEWTKLLKDHSNHHSSSDEFARVTLLTHLTIDTHILRLQDLIIKLFAFIKDRAQHPQQWLELFECTWMGVFFPEVNIQHAPFNFIDFFFSSNNQIRGEYIRLADHIKPPIIQPKDLSVSILVQFAARSCTQAHS